MLCALRRLLILLTALFTSVLLLPAHAQEPDDGTAGPSSSTNAQVSQASAAPFEPWYRGWRASFGVFLRYHSLDVAERSGGRSGSILAQHTYGIFPFASTPEWTLYKQGGQSVGAAVFFGAGQFTVNEQEVNRPGPNTRPCDTCDADNYQGVGTSVSGSYQFITPALVYTLGGGTGLGAFRMAAGAGVARGAASGDIYLTKSGSVPVTSGGHVAGSAQRVRFSETSSDYNSPSYILLMEFVLPGGWGFGASSDFMHINGKKYRLMLEEFRGGVSYEVRF